MSKGCLKSLVVLGALVVMFIVAALKDAGVTGVVYLFALPIAAIIIAAWKAIDKNDSTGGDLRKK